MTCLIAPWTGRIQLNAAQVKYRWNNVDNVWLYNALANVSFESWLAVCRVQYEFLSLENERNNVTQAGQELLREVTENLTTYGELT